MTRALALRGSVVAFVVAGVVVLGAFEAELDRSEIGFWFLLTTGAIATGSLISVFAFRSSGFALDSIARAARALTGGELTARAAYSPGPLSDLTHDFNRMAARLEAQVDELRADQARIAAVFAAVTDGLIALARDRSVEFLNPAAETMLDPRGVPAVGRPFIEVARDYELDALVRRSLANADEGPVSAVVTFGPRRTPLRATAIPVESAGSWALLLILTDLTELRRMDTVRRDFIGNVSHELRTPLASIRALTETIEAGYVDADEMPAFTSRIHRQVDRLTLLVTELLDLSRIESGAMDLHPERLTVGDAVREAVSGLQPRLDAAGLSVARTGEQDLAIEADRRSFVRITSNLLDNAIKFSPSGSTIRVHAEEAGPLVSMSVTDEGTGIPATDLPRVFERFFTGDKSRAEGGAGLGLAIVKHLVRAHNGTVEATSPPGQGATFTVQMPATFAGPRKHDNQAGRRPEGPPLSLPR